MCTVQETNGQVHDVEANSVGDAAEEPANGQNKSTVAAYAEDKPLLGLGTYCLSSIFLATVSTCPSCMLCTLLLLQECHALTVAMLRGERGRWPQALCHTHALLSQGLPLA